jgi:hypothetical protein
MSNVRDGYKSIEDIASIRRNAKNAADRRLALDWCLANRWVNANIGRLERVDAANWHGWKMWRWKQA